MLIFNSSDPRAGRWNNGDQMTGCYLTSLPFEFMRAVADFDPAWSGSYYVPRSTVRVPPSLLTQIWPELDFWIAAHKDPRSLEAQEVGGVEPNMAAGAFLQLLQWLREVLLQDAVFLKREFPQPPIFSQDVFRSPEFSRFEHDVEEAYLVIEHETHTSAVDKAIPTLAAGYRTLASQNTSANRTNQRNHKEAIMRLEVVERELRVLREGAFMTTWILSQNRMVQQWMNMRPWMDERPQREDHMPACPYTPRTLRGGSHAPRKRCDRIGRTRRHCPNSRGSAKPLWLRRTRGENGILRTEWLSLRQRIVLLAEA